MMTDLTISDAVDDPMIALMLDADHISRRSFAQFLESAARVLGRGDASSLKMNHYAVSQTLAHLPHANRPDAAIA
ncbi:hypothetical protein EV561_102254 [Rhizobium sp. BK376]|jgi:hypothetical protein|nr:hypothetical protein EV561_102254 [Rhizobium sp. BK376]